MKGFSGYISAGGTLLAAVAMVGAFALFGCASSVENVTNGVACYEAMKAATSASDTVANVENGAVVAVKDPACAALDKAAVDAVKARLKAQ